MTELSIFIDESGHFDSSKQGYYVLSMVLHEQQNSIAEQIITLDTSLRDLGFPNGHVVHSGAAIRGEEGYRGMAVSVRKSIFTRFTAFAWTSKISYKHFVFRKREFGDDLKLQGALARH